MKVKWTDEYDEGDLVGSDGSCSVEDLDFYFSIGGCSEGAHKQWSGSVYALVDREDTLVLDSVKFYKTFAAAKKGVMAQAKAGLLEYANKFRKIAKSIGQTR
jgi:Cys-tRNA synthase (O-phospho-L-seryl-tRNA:Cys-tRNA synthase)